MTDKEVTKITTKVETVTNNEEKDQMSIEEIASDPELMLWISKQPGFVEACGHAEAVCKANPYIHQM